MMKKELDYFRIEKSFGGNQDWFTDWWMHIGGCAAAAACDSCISLERAGIRMGLCPCDVRKLTKEEYISFAMKIKPYLRPRMGGIDKLEIYIDGMNKYLRDVGNRDLILEGFSSDQPVARAREHVKNQIDHGFPIPFLLLRHRNENFKDLLWHWFMLVGYEEFEEELAVKMATYGGFRYLSFTELWDSGHRKNGGMILYS